MIKQSPRKILFRSVSIAFFVFIVVFMYLKFQAFIYGPKITDISLEKYNTVDTSFIDIQGNVKYTEEMLMQGRSVTLDEFGNFDETIVFPPGHTIIEIQLTDPFEKTKFYNYHIYAEYNIQKVEDIIIDDIEETETTIIPITQEL